MKDRFLLVFGVLGLCGASGSLGNRVHAQDGTSATVEWKSGWTTVSVTLGGVSDVKTEKEEGWRNNGTGFTARAQAGRPVLISGTITGTPNVSYFDYNVKVTVRRSSGVLLAENPKLSKDGGAHSFSISIDPIPGSVEVEVSCTGGNPEFFTGYVSGRIEIVAPPTPTPRPAPTRAAEPADSRPRPQPTPTPVPLRVSMAVAPNPVAADGESTAEVVVTCVDDKGRAVPGVSLAWRIGPRLPAEEQGALSKTDGATGADGKARAIFRTPLLDAKTLQDVGKVKSRTIYVDYRYKSVAGTETANLSLLTSALVDLVVTKPSVETLRQPIRIGSLNGKVSGRVVLRARLEPDSNAWTDIPLNDAAVRLEGAIVKMAAIDNATSDEKGRFEIALRMSNWARWDGRFATPLVLAPSGEFVARQHRVKQHLEEWGGSDEVKSRTRKLVSTAQALLAQLPFKKCQGLSDKLQLHGWMLLVLKDGKDEGTEAAGEMLGHAWELIKAAASYAYEDSKFAKWVGDRAKDVETATGIRSLKTTYKRWLKNQGSAEGGRGGLATWISGWVVGAEPPRQDYEALGRARRRALDEALVSKLIGAVSDAAMEFVGESAKTGLIDPAAYLGAAIVKPYVDAGDSDLLLFLDNTDYERIATVTASAEARLSVRKARMAEERQKLSEWRIAGDFVKEMAKTAAECTQLGLNMAGAAFGQPELLALAKRLEKLHAAVDAAAEGGRFGAEVWNLCRIFSRSEEVVLTSVAEAAGVSLPAAVSHSGADGRRYAATTSVHPLPFARPARHSLALPPVLADRLAFHLLPVARADANDRIDVASGFDWALFALREGRVGPEARGTLDVLEAAEAGWHDEMLPKLLGLSETNPSDLRGLVERETEWRQSIRAARLLTVVSLGSRLSATQQRQWEAECTSLREQTTALQAQIDRVAQAVEHVDADPAEDLRDSIRQRTAAWAASEAREIRDAKATAKRAAQEPGVRLGRSELLFVGAIGVAVVLVLALFGGCVWVFVRIVRGSAPRLSEPPPFVAQSIGPVTALVDSRGRRYALFRQCTTIGSAPDNDIALSNDAVSHHHARVWRVDTGRFWIEDVGSTNGTWTGGTRIDRAWLDLGVVITLGEEVLRAE